MGRMALCGAVFVCVCGVFISVVSCSVLFVFLSLYVALSLFVLCSVLLSVCERLY